jgi:TPR repeat protein
MAERDTPADGGGELALKMKKKTTCATPTLTDCANCGASEGSILGTPAHNFCSRCEITFYCSVRCQKHHWKVGGHKKRCVSKEERSVAKALAAAKEREDGGGASGGEGGGGAKAKKKPRDKDNECAICLEDLDDPEFGPAQILECTHRFHRACVEELRKGGAKKCPTCRAKLPDSAKKMFDDGWKIFSPIKERVQQGEDGLRVCLSKQQQRQMDKVVRLWEGAAEQEHALAQYNLGRMYEFGHGVDVNYKKAIELYEKAAEQGDADAQCNLGVMYDLGHGMDVNYQKAVEWFEKAAEQGDADAQNNLGVMYLNGHGVDQSDSMAMRWFVKAAAQGDKDAQKEIDQILAERRASSASAAAKEQKQQKMYDDGLVIYLPIMQRVQQGDGSWGPLKRRQQRQMDKVVRLWEGAAEQGHASAQCNLGVMYKNGHGVDVNYKKAIKWYEKAAKQGYVDAQYNLGAMYENGQGVDVNYKKAIEWYEKAAEQGDADAQNNLGVIYKEGQGVDVNYKKAIDWYEKAAEQGHADAQYNLALMYMNGQGLDQSDSMAMRWFASAAAQGDKEAQEEIDKILTKRRATSKASQEPNKK